MTAADISSALAKIEAQIENGKALLPTNASLLQRTLFALKLALLNAGGVDPELAVKNKDQLEQLIAQKLEKASPDPAAQAALTTALNNAEAAQAQVQTNQLSTEEPSYPGLDKLRQQAPEDLSTEDIRAALQNSAQALKKSGAAP